MKNALLIAFSWFLCVHVHGQNVPFDKAHVTNSDQLKQALAAIKEGDKLMKSGGRDIPAAVAAYERAHAINDKNADLNMKLGLAHLNGAHRHKALPYFKQVVELDPSAQGAHFFLGYAQQLNGEWEAALASYEAHKRTQAAVVGEGDPRMANIEKLIVECKNGRTLSTVPTSASVTALGAAVNSDQADYGVLINDSTGELLFTSRRAGSTGGKVNKVTGEFFEDVYFTQRLVTGYSQPQPMPFPVNTIGNDATVCLTNAGNTVLIYRDLAGPGDIHRSDKVNGEWGEAKLLGPNVNTKYHEGSAWITNDGKWIYFVSERPEQTLGGQDIFRAAWDETAQDWGAAENLGPDVNSAFDEDGVFVSPDGNTIWFSSKGHNSIGGYDVFTSHYLNGFWSKARSLGVPVNSPDDDLYFVLSKDGVTGYFSSVRPGGEGYDDIYRVDLAPGVADAQKPTK